MHTQSSFRQNDPTALARLIDTYPLATVIHGGDGQMAAEHFPLLRTGDGDDMVLHGHVPRASSVASLPAETPVLAVFSAAAHYVSPGWYASKAEHGKVVPTWNYAVVHAGGLLSLREDPAWLRAHLDALTARHEASRPQPWQVQDAPETFIDRMLAGIVGVQLTVTSVTGKWKLSQNRSAQDRAGVARGLAAEGTPQASSLHSFMTQAGVFE